MTNQNGWFGVAIFLMMRFPIVLLSIMHFAIPIAIGGVVCGGQNLVLSAYFLEYLDPCGRVGQVKIHYVKSVNSSQSLWFVGLKIILPT